MMVKKVILVVIVAVFAFFYYDHTKAVEKAQKNIEIGAQFLAENSLLDGVITTDSGLQYKVLVKGQGKAHPTEESSVTVNYRGTLVDGTVFDSSIERGKPITFEVNKTIPGWREGMPLMVEGDKFRFYIPSHLAYGDRDVGNVISAGSLLIFDVDLISIN